MILFFRISVIFLFLFLSSCATTSSKQTPTETPISKEPPSQVTWNSRVALLSNIKQWELNGKIAVQTARDSGSATLQWAQTYGQYRVSLTGPLGSHSLKLSGGPGHAALETSEGKRLTARSAEELLAKQWGFNLPVSYLIFWVRGLPVAGVPYQSGFDSQNRLKQLSQRGFNVQFLSYTREGTVDLPDRISITSPSLKTKIIVYGWRVPH